MGWALGYDTNWQRDIGYGVPAYCDHPDCNKEIDRGLAFVCGGEPYGEPDGCGLYFCSKHLGHTSDNWKPICERCGNHQDPFEPSQEHPEWIKWKLTDESWQEWRDENPKECERFKMMLEKVGE